LKKKQKQTVVKPSFSQIIKFIPICWRKMENVFVHSLLNCQRFYVDQKLVLLFWRLHSLTTFFN
jgi:hypothetical protein